jgi:hypothetical protein
MNKEFIPYEQALALKELGFDEPCFTSYDDEKRLRNLFDYKNSDYYLSAPYIEDSRHWIFNSELTIENFIGNKDLYTQFIAAPLYQQAFRWFREKHELHSWITVELGMKLTYCWVITGENKGTEHKANFKTYEEAELECLKKLIEIVNQNKEDE